MNRILEILQGIRPDVNFSESENFIDDYLLDSFDIITLVAELEQAFDISIDIQDIVPESFTGIEAISTLICKYQGRN